ncbi:MAG: Ig-like domain-containing protein, partial [Paramuribaculum sp.]|nr:Ig-like domain-containing protein [Paramuribaculum sp.]
YIGAFAFSLCPGVNGTLTLCNSIDTIGPSTFLKCSGLTGNLVIPNSVTSIGRNAFGLCSGFTGDLVIPNSVKSIGDFAFDYCKGFKGTLTLSNSLETIGESAFQSCSGFTGDLVIPNSVTSIGDWTFNGCIGLTGDLVIPNSVTSIGEHAFEDCSGFNGTLTLGNSLETINEFAFHSCSGLQEVYYATKTPIEGSINIFVTSVYKNATLYVPEKAIERCKAIDPWKNFSNITPPKIPVESVKLNKETLELKVGETATLTATVLPDNATDKSVTWSSSNPDVATVNADGMITAIAVGETVISATCGEATAECKVTVNPVAAESVMLDKEAVEMKVGETAKLTATVMPDNTTDKTVTWASSNPNVATVNADGVITAIAMGEAVITATCGDVTAECKVIVNPVNATGINLNFTDVTLYYPDGMIQLEATVLPADCDNNTVTWASEDNSIASVSDNGFVIATGLGVTYIYATTVNADGTKIQAFCKVTVITNSGIDAAEANEPIITLNPMTINVGGVEDDCDVSVYTVAGQLIASEKGCCSIAVANRGIYIVKVGTKAVKVSVIR